MEGKISTTLIDDGDKKKIRVQLLDKNNVLILRAEMTPEEYGLMISGVTSVNCEINTFNNESIINKEKITKTVYIPYSSVYDEEFYPEMKKNLKEYTDDGWIIATNIKSFNHHLAGNRKYRIDLEKYI